MTGSFRVRDTDAAHQTLLRLVDHLLDLAQTVKDFDAAQPTIDREAGHSLFLRELIVPIRRTGAQAHRRRGQASDRSR